MKNKIIQDIWHPVKFEPKKWVFDDSICKYNNIREEWGILKNGIKDININILTEALKREHAVYTGIIEGMYALDRGVTKTLIEHGISDMYISHESTNIPKSQLMNHLIDHNAAINWVFDFVKDGRELSVRYIKELHILATKTQNTVTAYSISEQKYYDVKFFKGKFKTMPNNAEKNMTIYNYCPPVQVESEMDELIRLYHNELKDVHPLIKAAWLHYAFITIHPFQDGNGRMARLLASMVLIKDGMFPMTVVSNDKNLYIDALEESDQDKYSDFVNFIGDWQKLNYENAKVRIIQLSKEKGYRIHYYENCYDSILNMRKLENIEYFKPI